MRSSVDDAFEQWFRDFINHRREHPEIFDYSMNKKKTHGGKRKGAGRKKGKRFKEPTVVIRVPESKLEEVKKIIK